MVISKRCKICSIIEEKNVPIVGEYFGKQIPDIILKICGVELDPRKSKDVLICQSCVIQLVHVDVVIEKLRNSVQRLKKNVKKAKSFTPFKKTPDLNSFTENVAQGAINDNGNQSKSANESGAATENKKKIVRRKSVFPDDVDVSKQNGTLPISEEGVIKKSPAAKRKSTSSAIETSKISSSDTALTDTNAVKRNKTSKNEESSIYLTVDERDGDDTCAELVKEKLRNCILCSKIFHSKRTLREHIETAHMGERLKACPHCFAEFRSQQKYESHVFSEKCKSSNHPCQNLNCSKRFTTLHKMEVHMQQKHSSECE